MAEKDEGNVKKSSPEYMFGQIMARLESGDQSFNEIRAELKSINLNINQLPCVNHSGRIKNLEKFKEQAEKKNNCLRTEGLRFRHAVYVAIIASVLSGVVVSVIQALL